jgi:hypothetical protein
MMLLHHTSLGLSTQGGHVAHTGKINMNNILAGKPEGNRLFRRRRHRWENDINMI